MNTHINPQENRRPLKARGWKVIQSGAKWLSQKNITPNQISITSVLFSALAAACLLYFPYAQGLWLWSLAVMVVVFILCRALCNIFDGMVAIEGKKSTKSGELFNDMPDRIADALIIVAAGYAVLMPDLGWCAALLAVMTAYVRTLARGLGAPSDFRGPMAKVARMVLICVATLLTAFAGNGVFMICALALIAGGCILTVGNRARAAYLYLESEKNV
jgi:phosphatidylglycerophosphate synthase